MAAKGEFTKLGAARADLEAAWQDRLAEAHALHTAGRHAWAIATALYALEIRLKVIICKRLDLDRLPRAFETHDLESLLLLAGLSRRIEKRSARKVKENWEKILPLAEVVNDIRYQPAAKWAPQEAADLFGRLNDPTAGVMSWLSKQR
jgi:hypothetical protein